MTDTAYLTRERALERLVARLDRRLGRALQISRWFSHVRLVLFIAGVVCVVLDQSPWGAFGAWALGPIVLSFLAVAWFHNRLEGRIRRLRVWRSIKATNLARLRLDWDAMPPCSISAAKTHLYATDLDVTGQYSLLRLLDTTVSLDGRDRLAAWLLDQNERPADPAQWRRRQGLVKELARLPLFRDRIALEAMLVGEAAISGTHIRDLLQTPAGFRGLVPMLITTGALAGTTVVLALLSALTGLPGYWKLSFLAYAGLYLLALGQIAPVFDRALSLHHGLDKLSAVFRYLEGRSYAETPMLAQLCLPLIEGERRPSEALRSVERVCSALSIRAYRLVHLAVNAVCPWDLFFTDRLERWRERVRPSLPQWLDRLATLEAASALGTFASHNPSYQWPSLMEADGDGRATGSSEPAGLDAQALGHPLLRPSQRVTNEIAVRGVGRVVIVTGSNMSGKSTFLRTIGLNTCLAQAGAPVGASSFTWTWVRLACCIQVSDSLEEGLSYFYVEVKRLKRILDAAGDRSAPPVLFLIDEIFKGTNNRERLVGSQAFITALAAGNGLGLITTHDLDLTSMEKELPGIANAHFQETIESEQLRFDYRLRPGPCPTTNALKLMALEGLPVPDTEG